MAAHCDGVESLTSTASGVNMSLALLFSIDQRSAGASSVPPACCFCQVPLHAAGRQTHCLTMQHIAVKSWTFDFLTLFFVCPEAGAVLLAAGSFYGRLLYTPCRLLLPDASACSQVVVKVAPCVLHRLVTFDATTDVMQISFCPLGLQGVCQGVPCYSVLLTFA